MLPVTPRWKSIFFLGDGRDVVNGPVNLVVPNPVGGVCPNDFLILSYCPLKIGLIIFVMTTLI